MRILAALLLCGVAHADSRVDYITDAWNRGDSLAVQHHIHGDYAKATIGHEAEQGGTLKVLQHRFTGNGYEVVYLRNGKREVWTFTECQGELSTYFCDWQVNNKTLFGSAEKAQAFDVATSGLGMALGFAELNPLGVAILPAKIGLLAYSKDSPNCVTWRTWLDSMGIGAGVANLITIAAGIANPAIPIGIFAASTAIRYDSANKQAIKDCR